MSGDICSICVAKAVIRREVVQLRSLLLEGSLRTHYLALPVVNLFGYRGLCSGSVVNSQVDFHNRFKYFSETTRDSIKQTNCDHIRVDPYLIDSGTNEKFYLSSY